MSYLYMLLDIVSSLLILVSFTFAVSVKDNKANKKRECEEITENEIIILSKCNNIFWANLSYNPHAVELLKSYGYIVQDFEPDANFLMIKPK